MKWIGRESNDGRRERDVRRLMATGLATGMLALGVAGCKSKDASAPIVGPDGGDPAAANMAQPYTGGDTGGYGVANGGGVPAAGPTRVMGTSQSYAGQANGQDFSDPYGQQSGEQAAPIIRQAPQGADPYAAQAGYNQGYTDAEEAGAEAIADTDQAPPPLPEYDQPPAPDPNYMWTPGYWNYASAGYYWVPGVWVAPPFYGGLWTPPWWAFSGGHYRFHRGYWGSHVGFYGGINYGFGYIGTGYYGGYWRGHDFYYNRAVTNVNIQNVHNVYDRTVVFNDHTYGPRPENRVDFDGGRGGLNARPNSSEVAAMHEAHYAPVAAQQQNRVAAASNHGQFSGANGGHPAMAFAARPAGSPGNIAATPREQPFNHGGEAAFAGRPGGAPGATEHTFTGGNVNGAAARPGFNAGRATAEPGARPAGQPGPPSGAVAGRAGTPAQGRTAIGGGGTAPGGERQGFNAGRNTPGAPNQSHPNNGFNAAARTNPAPERPAAPAERQVPPAARPTAPVERQAFPAQRAPEPAFHPAAPAARPEAAPRQAAPAPAARPAAPAAAPHAAPAPHAGGGGEHGGHH